ncbi:HPP family protein [Polynucleobacter sp. UB-Raua-W9]|jgi:CBS-domain-containing membrane protein|uniref:HPP family protein n=1 Tax=Polynucleobacter sp. UB-Raua-W9 TaxID=1819736 RepID=UPI001BFD171A|nr:HPP family protein [Polynucleobacter sp. UB-Raua-W9]QWD72398.1 HPP family protein [Polynucleobacter sp. UB-Raua-W9]
MFLKKLLGDKQRLPPSVPLNKIGLACLGGFLIIAVLALLADAISTPLILGSFGATCVLVFAYPDAPFSQPRNVVLGHIITTFIGLLFLTFLGPTILSLALAVAMAIGIMILFRIVHPPAGSNPVIIFLAQPGWSFLIFPVATGAMIIVIFALIYLNLTRKENYPKYW